MHHAAMDACRRLLSDLPLDGARVLEIGAYDVNGSARGLLRGVAEIVGLDIRRGPGVDIVADGAAYVEPEGYDLILTTETLEHAPDVAGILARCFANLRPGGWLVLTAAGPGRPPHNRNGGGDVGDEHYANIAPDALAALLDGWAHVEIETNARDGDIYARAQRPPAHPTREVAQ